MSFWSGLFISSPCLANCFKEGWMCWHTLSPTFVLVQLGADKPSGASIWQTLLRSLLEGSKFVWHHHASTFNCLLQTRSLDYSSTPFNSAIQWKSINLHSPSLPLAQRERLKCLRKEHWHKFFNNFHNVLRKLTTNLQSIKRLTKDSPYSFIFL
jgi:hypothetical protein